MVQGPVWVPCGPHVGPVSARVSWSLALQSRTLTALSGPDCFVGPHPRALGRLRSHPHTAARQLGCPDSSLPAVRLQGPHRSQAQGAVLGQHPAGRASPVFECLFYLRVAVCAGVLQLPVLSDLQQPGLHQPESRRQSAPWASRWVDRSVGSAVSRLLGCTLAGSWGQSHGRSAMASG